MTNEPKTITKKQAKLISDQFQNYTGGILDFFYKMNFYDECDTYQKEIITLIEDFINGDELELTIGILGSKGCGKTSLISALIIYLLLCKNDTDIYYTSGKKDQSVNTFVKELKMLLRLPKIGNVINKNILEVNNDVIKNLFTEDEAKVLSYSHSEKSSGKEGGLHGRGLQVFCGDEASQIPNSIKKQADGLKASGRTIFIFSSNPEYHKDMSGNILPSFFYDAMCETPDPLYDSWHKFHINFLELTQKSEERKKSFASTYVYMSPDYIKNILGRYPPIGSNILINYKELQQLVHSIKPLRQDDYTINHLTNSKNIFSRESVKTIIAVDVAGQNEEAFTVVTARTNYKIEILLCKNDLNLLDIEDFLFLVYQKNHKLTSLEFVIDGDGVGQSLYSILTSLPRWKSVFVYKIHNRQFKTLNYCYLSLRDQLYGIVDQFFIKKGIEVLEYGTEEAKQNNPYELLININNPSYRHIESKLLRECRLTTFIVVDEKGGKKSLTPKKKLPESLDILDSIAYTFYNHTTVGLY